MAAYCGVDFHARQQTICDRDSAGGKVRLAVLDHERDGVRGVYAALAGEVAFGIEASGHSTWLVELVEGLGHRVLIGEAAGVRGLAKRRECRVPPPGEPTARRGPFIRCPTTHLKC